MSRSAEVSRTQPALSESTATPEVSRRRLFVGAGTAGALAVAAAATRLPATPAVVAPSAEPAAPSDTKGGYRLSAHVQRYYQTAKV